jgi:poly-gamma-glutamate synthesis protein (capsule biosynthesis protein)
MPDAACTEFLEKATEDSAHFERAPEEQEADIRLSLSGERSVGSWSLALTAPFFTVDSGVSLEVLRSAWSGSQTTPFDAHPLQVTPEAARLLDASWGPHDESVVVVERSDLVEQSFTRDAWTLMPFEALHPHLKVLEVDGQSPLRRDLKPDYPLQIPLSIVSETRADAVAYLPKGISNRDEKQMTIVALTGVTALTRGTSGLIEREGVAYPAQDVAELLSSADFTHISNEVSFSADCPRPHPRKTMSFCSHESYIEILEIVGADVIELTGNHNNDYGTDGYLHSLDLYEERGWKWFGGGRDLEASKKPAEIEHGPNRLAFLGCNAVGGSAIAKEDRPGARPCRSRKHFESLLQDVERVRSEGWLPIVTVQYWETYQYYPTDSQRADFEELADAGAIVVSGSQAHQAQGFGLRGDSFIHYGPGNLFFDQMQSLGTRQEFVDMLVFYDGALLSVELHTLLLEEYGRPRPTNSKEAETLLRSVFEYSHRKGSE